MIAKLVTLVRCIKWASISSCIFVGIGLTASPFWLYQQFDQETPIASLSAFAGVNSQYQINMTFLDTCDTQVFDIDSKQAQIDASFLKWQSWLTVLGVKAIYQFDRLSARDTVLNTVDTATTSKNMMQQRYDLTPAIVLPVFKSSPLDGGSSFLVDTQYGSSVYFEIDTALVYTIYVTEDGLILKSMPKKPLVDASGALLIDIDKLCSATYSNWHKVLDWLNKSILAMV